MINKAAVMNETGFRKLNEFKAGEMVVFVSNSSGKSVVKGLPMSNRVIIEISGPTKTKKTTIAVAIAKMFEAHGIKVSLPPDPERDEKMALPLEEILSKLDSADLEIMIMEMQSSK